MTTGGRRWWFFGGGVLLALVLVAMAAGASLAVGSLWRQTKARDLPEAKLEDALSALETRERRIQARLVRRLTATASKRVEQGDGSRERIELLVLSGGGQFGAFGAGVLEGWREVDNPLYRRPDFDLVTGVSAGAMLGSAATVDDPKLDTDVDRLFVEAEERWAVGGLWSYMPWRSAVLSGERLGTALETHLTEQLVARVARAGREGCSFLVMATNVDLGRPVVWDMTELADEAASGTGALAAYRERVRASASLPPMFPPVPIDGTLHVDGGASHLFFLGPDANLLDQIVESLAQAGIADQVTVRTWLVINSPLWPDKRAVSRRWPAVMLRSTSLLMFGAGRADLQRLSRAAEELAEEHPEVTELRFLPVPTDLDAPNEMVIGPEYVKRLRERGRALGRDPDSWKTEVERVF